MKILMEEVILLCMQQAIKPEGPFTASLKHFGQACSRLKQYHGELSNAMLGFHYGQFFSDHHPSKQSAEVAAKHVGC